MMQKESLIHPQAVIEDGAQIGENVSIGPFCTIGKNVTLKDNVTIMSNVVIDGYTTIDENTTIYPQAVIGTKTQDLKFRGEKTKVLIGKNCQIRECVTINSSCGEGTHVSIGDSCLIMAYCHIAHNCEIGNRVIMANNATLAGHVIVEDCAVVGGLSAVHQFSRIGAYAMVGGMSRVTRDVLPYTIGAGSPYRVGGLNLVGLKRHGFSFEKRKELARAFKLIYRSRISIAEALEKIRNELPESKEILHILEFCQASKRGIIGLRGVTASDKVLAKEDEELEEDIS